MSNRDKLWIKLMEWFDRYWGCHQMPERSFFFHKYQFPVCARCTGMILGYLLALLSQPFMNSKLIRLGVLCIPMALDGIIQYKTTYVSNNPKRLVTGTLFGYGFLGFIIQLIKLI